MYGVSKEIDLPRTLLRHTCGREAVRTDAISLLMNVERKANDEERLRRHRRIRWSLSLFFLCKTRDVKWFATKKKKSMRPGWNSNNNFWIKLLMLYPVNNS